MADDIINIASYSFDGSKMEQSLDALQTKLFELRKEQDANKKAYNDAQKEINELIKVQQLLVNANQKESESYKENERRIAELTKVQEQNFKAQQNTAVAMNQVSKEAKTTSAAIQAMTVVNGAASTSEESLTAALNRQIISINAARESNKELLAIRNQLNPSIQVEATAIESINKKLDSNNKFIKENVSGYEKQKINIGNYTESIIEAGRELGILDKLLGKMGVSTTGIAIGFEYAKKATEGIKGAFENFKNSLTEVKEAQEAFKTAQEIAVQATGAAAKAKEIATAIGFRYAQGTATETQVQEANSASLLANTAATEANATATAAATVVTNASSNALKLFRLALISTGIGAIVVVLGSLIAYLASTQEGIDKVTSITRPLQAIFSGLGTVLQQVGKYLVSVFENPKKAITDFANLIKENIINRFVGLMDLLPSLAKAIGQFFEGDFSGAAATATDAVAKVVTGVDGITGKITEATKATGKFFDEAIKKGQEIDRLTKQIEQSQLDFNRAQQKTNDLIKEQELLSKDQSKPLSERARAAQEIIRLNQKIGEQEADIVQKKIDRLKIEQKGTDISRDDIQEMIDLEEELGNARDRGKDAEIQQLKVISQFRKEAADLARAAAQKAHDDALTRMVAELKYYIESQGIKKKSLEEGLLFEQNIRDRELAILKRQLAAKKITQQQYDAEALAIQNNFLSKQSELAIENAELELEMFRLNNERKLAENEYFSSELYAQEIDRINRVQEAEKAALDLRLANGILNQKEYDVALRQLEIEGKSERDAAFKERETAQKEKEAIDLENERIAQGIEFEYDLQEQLRRYDIERAAQREAAKAAGADLVAFDKATAEQRVGIERSVQDSIQGLYADAFKNIATILGENTAAGKAAAIAEATISTYQAANKALAAYPPPFSYIAAGAAIATGLGNVKKIAAVKSGGKGEKPKYATGGLIEGGGTGTSDSIGILASRGESIINANSTSLFPELLSAINVAGGGVPFANNPILQNNLTGGGIGNADMSEMIAEAVARGAAVGTATGAQQGIRDLSNDRKVMKDAQF